MPTTYSLDEVISEGKGKTYSLDEVVNSGYATNKNKGASGSFANKGGASGTFEKPSGFMRGFLQDPISGLKQLGAETEIANFIAPDWAKKTREKIQSEEKAYQLDRGDSGIDWARLGGQVINPVNIGIAAATKTPPGASMLARTGYGAAGGALMGGASPTYGEATRGEQAALGGVSGAVAAPIAGGAARVVKPNVSPSVELLRKAGVTPTVGQSMGGMFQRMEDKATSFPIAGDAIVNARKSGIDEYQTAAYNRALNPIGKKATDDVGFEGMQKVHGELTKAYNNLLPKLSFKPDQQFNSEFSQLRGMLNQFPKNDQKIFDGVINKTRMRATNQGNMSGETFKNIESTIGDEIKNLSQDNRYEKKQIASALKQYRELLRQGLERNNPNHADELKAINEGWANYAIIRRAASGPQAAQTGKFTPSQLMQGVQQNAKRQGQATGQGKLSEGSALMQDLANAGYEVLPSKYPDSGTAGRIMQNLLVNPLVGIPQMATGATLGAIGSIPYLPGVRKGVDMLINARPNGAGLLSDVIRRNPALASTILPSLMYGSE